MSTNIVNIPNETIDELLTYTNSHIRPNQYKLFEHNEKTISSFSGYDLEVKNKLIDVFQSNFLHEIDICTIYMFRTNKSPVTIHTDFKSINDKIVCNTIFIPLYIEYDNTNYFINDDYSIESNVNTIIFNESYDNRRVFITYGCDYDETLVKKRSDDLCLSNEWWNQLNMDDGYHISDDILISEFADDFRGSLEQVKNHTRGFTIDVMYPNKKGTAVIFNANRFHTSGSIINKNASYKVGMRLDIIRK